MPGLTAIGSIETATESVNVQSRESWEAEIDESVKFPMGLPDDVFLHVSPCLGLFVSSANHEDEDQRACSTCRILQNRDTGSL